MNYDFADTTIADTAERAASAPTARAEAPADGHTSAAADTGTSAARRGPLTGPRAELAAANRELHAASAALDRCRGPVNRLRVLLADCTSAEHELETLRQRRLAELGKWLASSGSPDQRPTEPAELLRAEQSLARIQRDAAAARSASCRPACSGRSPQCYARSQACPPAATDRSSDPR